MPDGHAFVTKGYASTVRQLDTTRRRIAILYDKRQVEDDDMNHLYSALFLSLVTNFEGFLEDLFVGFLSQEIAPPTNVIPRAALESSSLAREIVLGGENYAEWLPYRGTRKRCFAFFEGGRPFSLLREEQEHFLDNHVMIIRNAIAHQSQYALKKFENKVLSGLVLAPKERTPGGYLRSIHSGEATRYEYYAGELMGLATFLCTGPTETDKMLEPKQGPKLE